jgi:hypothetical protein
MAMCLEGGAGPMSVTSPHRISDNRKAGAWVSNQLEDYPDGIRVKFIVQ